MHPHIHPPTHPPPATHPLVSTYSPIHTYIHHPTQPPLPTHPPSLHLCSCPFIYIPTYTLPIHLPPTHLSMAPSLFPSAHLYTNFPAHLSFHPLTNLTHPSLPAYPSILPARQSTLNEHLLAIHVFINLPREYLLVANIHSFTQPTCTYREFNIHLFSNEDLVFM